MDVTGDPMSAISEADVIRRKVVLRKPFAVEALPFLSRLHVAAFRHRRRFSRRFVGKPAKLLFRWAIAAGLGGTGQMTVTTAGGQRAVSFDARNTQFGAVYQPQNQPVYEPETSALLNLLVADNDVFYDIGANWGWYAILIATRASFRGSVHAFEPFPSNFRDLVSTVTQAGLEDRITAHEVALADREGRMRMGFSDGIQSGLARLGESGGAEVRIARLDDLGLPAPSVIKIDAEDHELEVLAGATKTIDGARPFIVFENWRHPERPALTTAPIALLAERRYRFFYPGWMGSEAGCVVMQPGPLPELALVPFLPTQRFQLPEQINVLAVPEERIEAFRKRILA
jgi:FkbM family methyltransferase